jgi:two-component sensor histidine kinase
MSPAPPINQDDLDREDLALLDKIAADLPIVADLCRADMLLYVLEGRGQVVIRAQARPHSSAPLYQDDRVGDSEPEEAMGSFQDMRWRTYRLKTMDVRGASVARQVLPVRNRQGRLIAMLARDAYWFAHERHRRRARAFQRALLDFLWMAVHGRLPETGELSPFREHDGIMYVDAEGRIRYLSGICAEIYRGLGYRDSLIDRNIGDLETLDSQMVQEAIGEGQALERSVEEAGGLYVRKVLPIVSQDLSVGGHILRGLSPKASRAWRQRGAFLLIHDATEAVKTQRELESQMAIVREVHHRVKNNLQVIASIMRMEARRAQLDETRAALEDGVQRILSVAVVHEFLSQQAEGTTINLRDVTGRIITQVQQSLLPPDKEIEVSFAGPDIWLPAERATQCALIVNELVQNAIEHGMAERPQGRISVELEDRGGSVCIVVADDGQGLGEGFDLDTQANLGLTLVRSMVVRDLRGRFAIESTGQGTRALVVFDK